MEKPVSTSGVLYEDNCKWFGGDPRHGSRYSGKLVLTTNEIRFVFGWIWKKSITYARASVRSVGYTTVCTLERGHRPEHAHSWDEFVHVDNPGLSLKIEDPEGAYPNGFDVRISFRSEYYAKVFGKRIGSAFGLPFAGGGE